MNHLMDWSLFLQPSLIFVIVPILNYSVLLCKTSKDEFGNSIKVHYLLFPQSLPVKPGRQEQ